MKNIDPDGEIFEGILDFFWSLVETAVVVDIATPDITDIKYVMVLGLVVGTTTLSSTTDQNAKSIDLNAEGWTD